MLRPFIPLSPLAMVIAAGIVLVAYTAIIAWLTPAPIATLADTTTSAASANSTGLQGRFNDTYTAPGP